MNENNTTREQRPPGSSDQIGFGAYLDNLIKYARMSQGEFSRKAGTAQPTVSAIVHGRQQMGLKLAEKFASALNLDGAEKAKFMMMAKKPRWKGMGHVSDGPEAMLSEAVMAILGESGVKPQSIASVLKVQQRSESPVPGQFRPDIVLLLKDGQTVDIELKTRKR